MKAIGLKSMMSLMTSLSKRNKLRTEMQTIDPKTLPQPLPKETVERMVKMVGFMCEEVELYNRHALPEEQVDMTELSALNRKVVQFPEIINSYEFAKLINEAADRKLVGGNKKQWCVFLCHWSSTCKKKSNMRLGLNI